jgi:hypothetical protein
MASPPIFNMSPGMSSGPTVFFLPTIANSFLIMLILMLNGSYQCDVLFPGCHAYNCIQKNNSCLTICGP